MEFLPSFLRRHLARKPVVALPNVGCFLRLGNQSVFILDRRLWLGNPKSFYGEKLTSATKVTLSLEKGDLATLVAHLSEPAFSFSCQRFVTFVYNIGSPRVARGGW